MTNLSFRVPLVNSLTRSRKWHGLTRESVRKTADMMAGEGFAAQDSWLGHFYAPTSIISVNNTMVALLKRHLAAKLDYSHSITLMAAFSCGQLIRETGKWTQKNHEDAALVNDRTQLKNFVMFVGRQNFFLQFRLGNHQAIFSVRKSCSVCICHVHFVFLSFVLSGFFSSEPFWLIYHTMFCNSQGNQIQSCSH